MPEPNATGGLRDQLLPACTDLGFDAIGIASAKPLSEERSNLTQWLARGYGQGMPYLSRDPEARFDPASLLSGCWSVIVLAHSVYTGDASGGLVGHIARYARGDDYHAVIMEKLMAVGTWLDQRITGHRWKATVDMSPISEKAFAVKAGIGWRGKNSLVLNRKLGSFFMLGLLLTTAELEPDTPVENLCGSCTKCIDACPVDALIEPGVLNASRCISFHTTGRKGDPASVADLSGRLFGCDICQDVCPYNTSPVATAEPRFAPRSGLAELDLAGLIELPPQEREQLLSGTAMGDYGLNRLVETAKLLLDR